MDRQPRPRFEPPPPAMSAFRESRIISAQMAASSSVSAAEASSRSELSVQQAAQSTARTADDDDADDANQTSTATFKFGAGVPAATTSNTVATPTDSNGSTITNLAASTSQPNTLSTSPSISSTATSDRDSDFPHRGPQNTGAAIQTSSKAFHAGGPSPGQISAAVVIPLLFLIALVFAILFLRRRRRRSNVVPSELQQQHHHPMADRSGAAFAKEAAYQSPRHVPRPSVIAPILTTTTNNTYYTGLSTPSTPSRTTSTATRGPSDDSTRGAAVPSVYDIPPPAYAKLPPPGSTPTLPQLSFPADPFMDPDPVSPLNSPSTSTFASTAPHTNAALAALSGRDTSYTAVSLSPNSSRNGPTPARPDISRAGTMRSAASVTSDMYSDTASVHSAKPARMSGAPNLVVGGGTGANWLDFESGEDGHRVSTGSEYAPGWVVGGHGGDPFRDPR
jgi:hypothetical protein